MFLPILGLLLLFTLIVFHAFKPNQLVLSSNEDVPSFKIKANPFYYFGVSMKKKKHNMLRISKLKRK